MCCQKSSLSLLLICLFLFQSGEALKKMVPARKKNKWQEVLYWTPLQCVVRYGLNWHLAAYAVSSGMTFLPACSAEGGKCKGEIKRHSAVQCQNCWMTLERSEAHISFPPSPPIVTTSTPTSDPATSIKFPVNTVNSLFLDEVGVVGDGASSINQ
jgi:hypothetical protein